MKNLLLLILFAGSLILIAAKWNADNPDMKTSIQFTDASWSEVLKRAKEENKIIFLDIYASWCGPCKLLKRTTFNDEEVGTFFNSNFVNVTVDGEKGEGRKLAMQYDIHAYPTLLFVNPDGSVRKTAEGYHSANQLLKAAKSALK